jgi:hypothetical protein
VRHLVNSHTCGQVVAGCSFRGSRHIVVEDWKLAHFQGKQHARLSGLKVVINIILSFQRHWQCKPAQQDWKSSELCTQTCCLPTVSSIMVSHPRPIDQVCARCCLVEKMGWLLYQKRVAGSVQEKVHHNTDMQDCEAHLEYIEPNINRITKEWASNWVVSRRATCSGSLCSRAEGSCVHTLLSLKCVLALAPVSVATDEHTHSKFRQLIHEGASHYKQSGRTFRPNTAVCRYLRADWMQSQTCTAAAHRKKRSLSRRIQPAFLCKGYSSTGAESKVTCSAAKDSAYQPQASNKKG